jgi:hypothetical protein
MLLSKPVSGAGATDAWCWSMMFRVTCIVILGLVGIVVPFFRVEVGGHVRGAQ